MSPLICPAASWCCTPTAVLVPFSSSVTSPSSRNHSWYRPQDLSSFHHHICCLIAVSCEGMNGLWQNFQLIYPLLETKGEKRLFMDVRRQNVCLVVIFCHLVEGLSGIFWLLEAQHRYSDILFLLQNLLFSNQMSETLRSNLPLGPVVTSLERNGCRAGVWQAALNSVDELWLLVVPRFLHRSCRSDCSSRS